MKFFLPACVFAFVSVANAQVTHYDVRLTPDFEHHLLRGVEEITFAHMAGLVEWNKQAGMQILKAEVADGDITNQEETVRIVLRQGGTHRLKVEYTAPPGKGFNWPSGDEGFDTAFYCEAWIVCDNSPGQRATLRLEVVLPDAGGDWNAVGPGERLKVSNSSHVVFEQRAPVQTYLFSFAVARLKLMTEGRFSVYAADDDHGIVFERTSDVYQYLRGLATVDPVNKNYAQAFLPPDGLGQEAAGMALMSAGYLTQIEENDSVYLMAHELAHQWWGVTVGIRSWSDFWLNEGMAEFVADAYVSTYGGRGAYEQRMVRLRERMDAIRAAGKDRPLHWEGWKDAHEALGELPYVKGALFLDRLRTQLGERAFWTGLGKYTALHAGGLVDSRDFQKAMESTSGLDLKSLFDAAVYQ